MTMTVGVDNSARDGFRNGIMFEIDMLRGVNPSGMFDNHSSDDYVFNGVMLMRDFGADHDELPAHVCDGSGDLGVDAWWYDDYMNTLYLVQNKLYAEGAGTLKDAYVKDALHHAYDVLCRGEFSKCAELQDVFSAHVGEDDFYVHHRINVTSASACGSSVRDIVREFNECYGNANRYAEIADIDDLFDRYYGEPYVKRHRMTHVLKLAAGKNAGDYVQRDIEHGKGAEKVMIRGFVVWPSVLELYELFENAIAEDYNLFEDNVREYLGKKGVNKDIRATLEDPDKRNLFGLLNNGITVTCMGVQIANRGLSLTMQSPQVVNGCQTLSTIHSVLSGYDDDDRERLFKKVTVQLSIFGMDGDLSAKRAIIDDIVNCRNSQTAIQKNMLDILHGPALRIKQGLADYGIAIGVKPSDCNQITSRMGKLKPEDYRERFIASGLAEKWGFLDGKKPNKLVIGDNWLVLTYEKLCQVVCMTNLEAFNPSTKSGLLDSSKERTQAVTRILCEDLTIPQIADLVCLYLKVMKYRRGYMGEHEHSNWFPSPAHTLTGITRIECGGDIARLSDVVRNADDADMLMRLYAQTCDEVFGNYLANSAEGDDTYTKFVKTRDFKEQEFVSIHDNIKKLVDMEIKIERLERDAEVKPVRICTQCGIAVANDAKFCPECGHCMQ